MNNEAFLMEQTWRAYIFILLSIANKTRREGIKRKEKQRKCYEFSNIDVVLSLEKQSAFTIVSDIQAVYKEYILHYLTVYLTFTFISNSFNVIFNRTSKDLLRYLFTH